MRCIAVIPTENTTASVWNSSSPQRTPVTAPVASFRTRSVTLFPDKNWQPPPRMDATHGLKIISPTVPLHHTTSKSGCKPHRIKSHIKVEDNHSLGIRIKSLKKPLFCHYHHGNSSRDWHQFPQGVTYRYLTEIRWRDGEEQTNTREGLQSVFRAENLMSQNEVVQHAKTGSSTAKLAWCKQAHQQHWVEGILIHSIRASKLTKQLPCRPYDQLQVQHVRMK